MGYTIYWKTDKRLTVKEIKLGVKYLRDNYNRDILKEDFDISLPLNEKTIYLNPIREVAVETLVFNVNPNGRIKFRFCKTNRYEPEDTEIKRLLVGLQNVLKDKLNIHCDDGFDYSSQGIWSQEEKENNRSYKEYIDKKYIRKIDLNYLEKE